MFIAFEGIDGAGKSTVSDRLGQLLEAANVKTLYVNKKSVSSDLPYLQSHIDRIRTLIWGYPYSAPIERLGDGHWLHLMSSWFYLVEELEINPALKQGNVVIIEGWTAKFIARYALKSESRRIQAIDAMECLVVPDLTFYLKTDPKISASRKQNISPSECGALDNKVTVGKASFTEYQSRLSKVLDDLASSKGWHCIETKEKSVEFLAQSCFQAVINSINSNMEKNCSSERLQV